MAPLQGRIPLGHPGVARSAPLWPFRLRTDRHRCRRKPQTDRPDGMLSHAHYGTGRNLGHCERVGGGELTSGTVRLCPPVHTRVLSGEIRGHEAGVSVRRMASAPSIETRHRPRRPSREETYTTDRPSGDTCGSLLPPPCVNWRALPPSRSIRQRSGPAISNRLKHKATTVSRDTRVDIGVTGGSQLPGVAAVDIHHPDGATFADDRDIHDSDRELLRIFERIVGDHFSSPQSPSSRVFAGFRAVPASLAVRVTLASAWRITFEPIRGRSRTTALR